MEQLTLSAMTTCYQLLEASRYSWESPRVKDWLKRVGHHYQGKPYKPGEALPEFVYVSLAKYLDVRLKCNRLLKILQWSWDHPTVRAMEERHECFRRLPLKGYCELHDELDKVWLEQGGGF